LDHSTAACLLRFIHDELVVKERKLVLLVTHSLHLLREDPACLRSAKVLLLRKGAAVFQGALRDLPTSEMEAVGAAAMAKAMPETGVNGGGGEESVVKDAAAAIFDDKFRGAAADSVEGDGLPLSPSSSSAENDAEARAKGEAGVEDGEKGVQYTEESARASGVTLPREASMVGCIRVQTYSAYFRAAGVGLCAAVLLSTALMQGSSMLMFFWLAYWSSRQDEFSTIRFVYITSGILLLNLIFGFLRSFLFARGGLVAARKFYDGLAASIFGTPMRFFEENPVGRIGRLQLLTPCQLNNPPSSNLPSRHL
jgi:hypothetical protein